VDGSGLPGEPPKESFEEGKNFRKILAFGGNYIVGAASAAGASARLGLFHVLEKPSYEHGEADF
jgi:hypothetical protein